MIVDDALFMRTTLRKVLSEGGCTVVGEAENGQVALEQYQQLKPDVVLMDITMPVMDGLTALKEIKKVAPDARVIMCTAIGQERSIMDALHSGARDYIVKPFKPEKVLEAVRKVGADG